MENNKISINTGVTIEVNDNGDTIVARIDDALFIDQFHVFLEKVEAVSREIEMLNTENDREALRIITEKTKILMGEIDNLFGKDACKKIFGDIIPSGFAIAEFVEQLIPIFNNYTNARQKKISDKYSNNRKGGGKSYYRGKKAFR